MRNVKAATARDRSRATRLRPATPAVDAGKCVFSRDFSASRVPAAVVMDRVQPFRILVTFAEGRCGWSAKKQLAPKFLPDRDTAPKFFFTAYATTELTVELTVT